MKRTLALWLILLMPCATAADFRALNYGDDCSNLETQERLLGATPVSTDQSPFIFQGEYRGKLVSIAYLCSAGRFSQGHYSFERTTFEIAEGMYVELKQQLSIDFGAPFHDGDSEEYRKKVEGAGLKMSETDRYSARWLSGRSEISVALYGPAGGEGWRVYVAHRPANKI
jgi:hypothetical protein